MLELLTDFHLPRHSRPQRPKPPRARLFAARVYEGGALRMSLAFPSDSDAYNRRKRGSTAFQQKGAGLLRPPW
jgi:hypothetical protein